MNGDDLMAATAYQSASTHDQRQQRERHAKRGSGRNRIVRRMMAAVGHPVLELVRRQFGPLHLGTLPVGRARELTKVERGALLTLARGAAEEPPPASREGESG